MNRFTTVPYHAGFQHEWDEVVRKSKNGNFLHLRNYMDYHSHRFNDVSVLIEKSGKTVAAFPANRCGEDIVSHDGLTYGGLIYGTRTHTTDILEIFYLLVEHYRKTGACRLVYKPVPHIYHRYPAEEDLYSLFRLGAVLVRRDIASVVSLQNRIGLSELRTRSVRKSKEFSLEIREGDFVDRYHALLTDVLARFHVKPVHSSDELILLKNRFPNNIRLFGAFLENRLLAGTIVYDFGHVAHTQYLANSLADREICALDAVIFNLIEHVFSQYRYFSFGISTENRGRHLNEGLIFQKEGFGARGVVHDCYELRL